MKSFNSVISHIFRILLLFLLVFIWIRFYERSLGLAVLYSTIICIILDLFLTAILQKREKESTLKADELKLAENFANHFAYNDSSVALGFFHKLLSKQFQVQKKSKYLWWENEGTLTVFFPLFQFDATKIRDLFKIFNSIKLSRRPDKIIVSTSHFDAETRAFAMRSPVNFVLLDQFDTYEKLMKPENFYPDVKVDVTAKKGGRWQAILEYALSRKRTKAWVTSSLLLIFSSFFVRVSVYYLIISSILLILAIFSYTNIRFNPKTNEKIF